MDEVQSIEYPQSREQLALLLMRYNALLKQGVDARFNAEMFHLTHVLSTLSHQQLRYEERLKTLKAKRKQKPCDISDQIVGFKLLSRKLDLPAELQGSLLKIAGVEPRTSSHHASGWKGRQHDAAILAANKPLAESVIRNRITHRLGELERLPSHIGTWDASNPSFDGPQELTKENDRLKLRALIEMKGLRVLAKQRSMRQHLLYALSMPNDPADERTSAVTRMFHRRVRPASIQDMQLTEQLERQRRYEREQKERAARLKMLESTLSHAQAAIESNNLQRSKRQALLRGIMSQHTFIEREQAKVAERTAKQRLQALRSNDEEAYLKLLDQTKDTRITHLLKQTNSFLRNLSKAVRSQQRESGYAEEDNEEEDIEKIDYYEVAHRVKENITAQPKILAGGNLKEYQLKGLQWMVSLVNNNLNGILADEMGLGKTIQTISLITYLIEVKKWSGPFLIIVPLSTVTNWNLELDKWAPSVKKVVYKGSPIARKALQSTIRAGDFQVCLTTYEYIIKDRFLLSKIKWEHMIIDEGHRMKNTSSKLSMTIANFYYSRFRLILTGTPLQNNLPELWALLNFVLPKIFNSVKTFDEWFNTPFANTGGQDKIELTEEETLLIIRRLHKVLRPFLLRRLKKDVEKDLPDKVEKVVKCKMSALQSKLYEHMLKHNLLYVGAKNNDKGGGGIKGLNNKIMQLRKICNHPFVFEEVENFINPTKITDNQIWRTAGKFELLDRILPKFRATGHRTLMFFQMTQVMSIMEDYLLYKQIPYLRLDGATKADERSDMLKRFNAPDSPYFCFLLSTRAGGLGLNLQTADTVIIYDTDWNPFQDLQAQDRAHRIGQTKEVRILRLITEESVEEAILDRAHMKLEIDGKVIQAGKFDNKSTSEEQEAFLRSLIESEEQRRDGGPDDEELDDEELNEILARSDEEAKIFADMDKQRLADQQEYLPAGFTRLFAEDELPEIYKRDIATHLAQREHEALASGGRRERRSVRYNETITDDQWLAEQEEEDARKNRRRSKRSSPMPEAAVDSKKPKTDTLTKKARQKLQSQLSDALEQVFDLTAEDGDGAARQCASIFMMLPAKKAYPDYYKVIKTPISIAEIQKRVNDSTYESMDEFKQDFELMFSNARKYNDAESFVVKDAEAIEELLAEL